VRPIARGICAYGRGHRALLDREQCVRQRVEAHHHDLAGPSGLADRGDRAERQRVVVREYRLQVRVRREELTHRRRAGVGRPLGARLDDADAGLLVDDIVEAAGPVETVVGREESLQVSDHAPPL